MKSRLLTRPVRKLYKLELCAESVNLQPITSPPENTDKNGVILDSEDEVTDEEEAECGVSLPQKARRGRVIFRPRLMESQHATASCEVEDVES